LGSLSTTLATGGSTTDAVASGAASSVAVEDNALAENNYLAGEELLLIFGINSEDDKMRLQNFIDEHNANADEIDKMIKEEIIPGIKTGVENTNKFATVATLATGAEGDPQALFFGVTALFTEGILMIWNDADPVKNIVNQGNGLMIDAIMPSTPRGQAVGTILKEATKVDDKKEEKKEK